MRDDAIELLASIEDENWWNEGRRRILCDFIKSISKKNDLNILDIGCGPGGTSTAFKIFGTVIGVDFSNTALKIALRRGLQVFKSTLETIPIKDKSFDLITALDVIEHIQDEKNVLIEINRILKSDGFVVITVPAFQFLWSEHDVAVSHVRRYNISSLKRALHDAGFSVVRISYFVSFVFPLVAIYRLLTKSGTKKSTPKPNLHKLPKFLNSILEKTLFIENNLLKKFNLPFGVSIICIARKK